MASESPSRELMTINAAAQILGVSEQTLRRWDRAGKFRANRHPMNGYRLYRRSLVLNLMKRIRAVPEKAEQ